MLAGFLYNLTESAPVVFAVLALSLPWEAAWLRLCGATPGHLVAGIRVHTQQGRKPGFGQGLRRSLRRPALALSYGSSGAQVADRGRRRLDEDLGLTTNATRRTRGMRGVLGLAVLMVTAAWIAIGNYAAGSSVLIPPDGAWWTGAILMAFATVLLFLDPVVEPDLVMGTIVPSSKPMLDEIVAEAPPQLRSDE
jgi:uncharacterized RDD family membrane protein YckC